MDNCGHEFNTKPEYPKDARRAGAEATVTLSLDVDEKGNGSNAHVLDNTGLDSFSRSALDAVKCWRFRPATDGGKRVAVKDFKIRINFKCHDAGSEASKLR